MTRISVLRTARAVLVGLSALAASVAASTLLAHADASTQAFDPVDAGRGYVYWVKEHDTAGDALPGRTVTLTVQRAPGPGAAVAPSDATGRVTGARGQAATQVSGGDGLAYFRLWTSTTPGENDFIWQDANYSGLVTVVGRAVPGGVASASPVAGRVGTVASRHAAGAGTAAAAGHAHLPPAAMPPLAAALLAMLLVFIFVPPVLARNAALAELAARLVGRAAPGLVAGSPSPSEAQAGG
jgi:hypothetical protein